MSLMRSGVLILILAALFCSALAESGEGDERKPPAADSVWLPVVERIRVQPLDSMALPIAHQLINHVDFTLNLDTGTLFLYEPVVLNGTPHYYGGCFVGEGHMSFKPRLPTERDQVRRFFDADSVSVDVNHAELMFTDLIFNQLAVQKLVPATEMSRRDRKVFEDAAQAMKYHSDYYSEFATLMFLLYAPTEPVLQVNVIKGKLDQVQYSFDPFDREEVTLGKVHPESRGVENVCSYSRLADDTFANINGESKDAVVPRNYQIDASIDEKGMLRAMVELELDVRKSRAQFLTFLLHSDVEVESVETGDGRPVEFIREERESLHSPLLLVLLPAPPDIDIPLVLRFRYHGDLARRDLGLFFVDASTIWYPRFNASNWTDFDMRFKTPAGFTLIASAPLIDSSTVGDTLFTHWRTDRPEKGMTFNIAEFESHICAEEGLPVVELYHNKPLHKALLKTYREDWYEDMAAPILSSLRMFSAMYGEPIRDRFRVSEILYSYGESFPGFINLSLGTFANQHVWGEDMMFRSHEVAHQWWGSTVGYETYHDQWLSEGLATYSSLRYCHTELQHSRFLEKLREFRDNVYSVRKAWFYSGAKSGAIIQGYRTNSSKTDGDFRLVIYEKAALIMHMLRCHLTDWSTLDDSRFNDLLKEYYLKYAGRNACTQDFRNLLEEQTGIDWGWFFNQWVYGNDLPEYNFHKELIHDASDGVWRAVCTVEQKNVGPDFTVIMPVEIEFDEDRKQYTAVVIRGESKEFTLAFEEKPKAIRLNPFEAVLAKVNQ